MIQKLAGILEPGVELLPDITAHQEGDEGSHWGAVEPCDNLPQVVVDGARIEPGVELLVAHVRDVAQFWVH